MSANAGDFDSARHFGQCAWVPVINLAQNCNYFH